MADDIILPPNSKAIPLTQGKFAIVDEDDYEWLNQWKWNASIYKYTSYAVRTQHIGMVNGKQKTKNIKMHRLIIGASSEIRIDHKDMNGLNNRRSNLRICTISQNASNCLGWGRGSSRYKGVTWYKKSGKWQAKITVNYKTIHLGHFFSELDAAMAYNEAALQYHGEFARLNEITE